MRQMLVAVLLVGVGLGVTRAALILVVGYEITPWLPVDAILFLLGIGGAGVAFGLAVARFIGARKTCAAIGAVVWPLLILNEFTLVAEVLRLDRAGWQSPRGNATHNLVVSLATDGAFICCGVDRTPREGIDEFLQQLENEGFSDARRDARGGLDYWGRQLIVDVDGDVLRVRSTGRDGIDQRGGGDDIQASVDYKNCGGVQVVPGIRERRQLFAW